MTSLTNTILIVEDNFFIQELLCIYVAETEFSLCGRAASAADAVALAKIHRPAIVLMDVRLQGSEDGVDAAIAITASVGSKIVFLTASKDPHTVARINTAFPVAVIFKPFTQGQIRSVLKTAAQEGHGDADLSFSGYPLWETASGRESEAFRR